MNTSITERYQQLIDEITEHNRRYYLDSHPIISDQEYDQLFAELKHIEEEHPRIISENSPTQSLVGQIAEGFEKVARQQPLLSLENSYDAGDLRSFDDRVKKVLLKHDITSRNYTVEPKFDGLSVELVYEDGELVQGITRGDGLVGEDVTQNVKTIRSLLPLTPPSSYVAHYPRSLHVRGEVMLAKSKLQALNQEREKAGLEPFSNTRNAASGSLKLLDSREVAKRGLSCFVYELLSSTFGTDSGDLKEEVTDLADFGLPTFKLTDQLFSSIEEVIAFCLNPETKKKLEQQDFDFDGLVVKVVGNAEENGASTSSLRDILGHTNHHPRWAIAYKFPAQQASTQILRVDFQVGRSGIITPVANLRPVQLSGAEISRASLHNFDFVKEKDIKLHDWVWVQRSGEVIPYITGVIKERRTGEEDLISAPLFCPSCQGPIVQEEMHYYCRNPHCPAQIKEKVLHFVSRDCLDISGIGESITEILMSQKLLQGIEDLYRLERPEAQIYLKKLPGFGEKKIFEILQGLEKSKTQPLWRILNGIGIPNIGTKLAKDLAQRLEEKKIKNLNEMIFWLTNEEFLLDIEGIGEKIQTSFSDFFANEEVKKMLEGLVRAGMKFEARSSVGNGDSSSEGSLPETTKASRYFSITGTFPISREKIKEALEKAGFQWVATPHKAVEFVLVGHDAGKKETIARELGLKIYDDWDEILRVFPDLKALELPLRTSTTHGKENVQQQSLF